MKSDREYLEGIYFKAKTQQFDKVNIKQKSSYFTRRPLMLVMSFAMVFMMGFAVSQLLNEMDDQRLPTPIKTRANIDVELVLAEASDIVEVTTRTPMSYQIIEEYKGNLTWSEKLNNEVNRLLNDYNDQRMIILLNDSQELLDIYVNDFDADTYINLSGDVLSKDMISNLK